MHKIFLSADELYKKSFLLAEKIFESGFLPDFLIMLMRGGAPIGIIVHEYFRHRGKDIEHNSIKAVSYTSIGVRKQVVFKGLESLQKMQGKKVLIVDDIFDTGKTAEALLKHINGGKDVRIASLFFKPKNNLTNIKPDYYISETDSWIVFPHELEGLSREELKEYR